MSDSSIISREFRDPTANVTSMIKAAERRSDDLLLAHISASDAKMVYLKEIADLRADHSKVIHQLESDRLNAVRNVDVAAVKTEAERAAQAIQALAAVTASNAETLRTALNNTATTIANQTTETVNRITERIAALEKSSYEGAGKSTVADPMISTLVTEMRAMRSDQDKAATKSAITDSVLSELVSDIKALRSSQETNAGKDAVSDPMIVELIKEVRDMKTNQENTSGKSEGTSSVVLWIFGGVAALGTIIGLGGTLVSIVLYLSHTHA